MLDVTYTDIVTNSIHNDKIEVHESSSKNVSKFVNQPPVQDSVHLAVIDRKPTLIENLKTRVLIKLFVETNRERSNSLYNEPENTR